MPGHRRFLALLPFVTAVLTLSILVSGKAAAIGGDDVAGGRSEPDPVYFEDIVVPFLDANCATSGCHGAPGAGRLILERRDFLGRDTRQTMAKNLATTLQFVKFGEPMESRLVLKPLRGRDGGIPHSAANYRFAKGSEKYQILADWIEGKELQNVRPVSDAGSDLRIKRGQVVRLDGTASRDRRSRDLSYLWSVVSRPEDSEVIFNDSDTPTPQFKADSEGAYTLSLVVDNGELESAPSTITVEVDNLPSLLVRAEEFTDGFGFYAGSDSAATGGVAIRTGQEAGEAGALAAYNIRVPLSGPYRIHARVRSDDRAAGEFRFSVDGSEDLRLASSPSGRYQFLEAISDTGGPVADTAFVSASGGQLVHGGAEVKEGALSLYGNSSRPAVMVYGEAPSFDRIATRIQFIEGNRGQLHTAAAYVIFGYQDPSNYRFGGFRLGRSEAVIGEVVEGAVTDLASRRYPVRPERDLRLELSCRGDTAFLFLGEGELLEAEFSHPAISEQVGLLSTSHVVADDLELQWTQSRDQAYQFGTAAAPDGFLSAGDHQLLVRSDSDSSPWLDEILLVHSDFNSGGGPEARKMVRAVYLDLYGRTPLAVEYLMATGLDRDELVNRMVGSLEFYEVLFERELYYYLLLDNFRPKTPELVSIPARLANGQLDLHEATHEIVISQYFNARNPGNDTFVSVVLEQLLGMVVQDKPRILEAGKKMYDGYRISFLGQIGTSQSDVVRFVLDDSRFEGLFLKRKYREIFGVDPSKRDLARWSEAFGFDGGSFESILTEWYRSDAYGEELRRLRQKTDPMWIRSLYVDLLGRRPTFEEYRNFRNALQALSDSTALRSVLAKVMLDSGQVSLPVDARLLGREFVEDSFVRFLSRNPTPDELQVFSESLASSGASASMILHALISSVEYQYY